MIKEKLIYSEKGGLHARQATLLMDTANKFNNDVFIKYKNSKANVKSVLEVVRLGVLEGSEIELEVHGENPELALEEIKKVIQ